MTSPIDYAKEYDNSGRVADADQLIENYVIDASLFREAEDRVAEYDIEYAPRTRNKMDIFWPKADEGKAKQCPLVMFIHGGYWQRMDKSSFSHLARGLNHHGIAVVMPSYTLCPNTKIEGIITELRCACLVLYQAYKKKFAVAGHSAGGHLAACLMATDWEDLHSGLPFDLVTSGMGISGLYDLMPLLQTPVNDAVRMDEAQARRASPLKWVPDGSQRFQAWVGGDESNEYHRQSRELASHWSLIGTPTDYVSVPGKNHFTIIDGLTDPESEITKALVDLVQNPQVPFKLREPEEKPAPPRPAPKEPVAEAKKPDAAASEGKPAPKPAEPAPKAQPLPPKPPAATAPAKPTEEKPAPPRPAPKEPVAEAKKRDTPASEVKPTPKPVEPAPKAQPVPPKPPAAAAPTNPTEEKAAPPKPAPKEPVAEAKKPDTPASEGKPAPKPAEPAPKAQPVPPKPPAAAAPAKPAGEKPAPPRPAPKEPVAEAKKPDASTSEQPAKGANAEKTEATPKEKS